MANGDVTDPLGPYIVCSVISSLCPDPGLQRKHCAIPTQLNRSLAIYNIIEDPCRETSWASRLLATSYLNREVGAFLKMLETTLSSIEDAVLNVFEF